MSTLYLRGKIVWIGYSVNGTRYDRSTRIKLSRITISKSGEVLYPREALECQRTLDARIQVGDVQALRQQKKKRLTIQEAFDRFLLEAGGTKKPNTIRLYRLSFKKMITWFKNVYIQNLTYSDFYEFRRHYLEVDGEQNTAIWLRHLGSFFNWAASEEVAIIDKSPITKKMKLNPPAKPPEIYSEADLEKIRSAATPILWQQLRFLLLTGFRSGESCAIKWDQIDFDHLVIRHFNEKGNRWDNYPMNTEVFEFLYSLPRRDDGYLYHYRSGSGLNHALADLELGLSESANVHTFKETYIYKLITNPKLSFAEVHFLSHHKDIQTTMKYYAFFNIEPIRAKMD